MRGANLIEPHPQRMGTPQDARWATGRNVKRSLPDRRYDGVEVWALKRRAADGTVEVIAQHQSREAATAWVEAGVPPYGRADGVAP